MLYLMIYLICGICYYLWNQKELDKIAQIIKRCLIWNTNNPEFVKEQMEKAGINPHSKAYFLWFFTPVVLPIMLIKGFWK